MEQYYEREIASVGTMQKPLATEGRIQGLLLVNGIEFKLMGRYDRLDFLADGLELIDYKSAKSPTVAFIRRSRSPDGLVLSGTRAAVWAIAQADEPAVPANG